MDRRRFVRRISVLGAVSLAGCTDLIALGSDDYDIGMSANAFLPREFTIQAGGTVIWENDGSRAHTVTAYSDRQPEGATYFASGGYDNQSDAWDAWHDHEGGNLYLGERFEHTFEVPGRHEYFCVPHERMDMTGAIIVED